MVNARFLSSFANEKKKVFLSLLCVFLVRNLCIWSHLGVVWVIIKWLDWFKVVLDILKRGLGILGPL